MGKVRYRGMNMVRITFSDKNFVPGSIKYVDLGTRLTLQNQNVPWGGTRCELVEALSPH